MTFNFDAVTVSILAIIIGAGYRAWDSIQKAGKERQKAIVDQMKEMHSENKAALAEVVDDKERAHTAIHLRLNEHGERITRVAGDINAMGFRVSAVESDVKELKEER